MSDTVGDLGQAAAAWASSGDVWKPRLQVHVGAAGVSDLSAVADQLVPTALSAKTLRNTWYQADKFQLTFELWKDPSFGPPFWTAFKSMSVLVEIGFEGTNGAMRVPFTEVYRGFTDKIHMDMGRGIVTLTGRNILGQLIDARDMTANFEGTSKSLLSETFAAQNVPLEILPGFTDTPYGRKFSEERSRVSVGDQSMISPADLVGNILATAGGTSYEEKGTVFVDGINPQTPQAFLVIAPQGIYENGVTKLTSSNCTSLIIEHDLTFSQWGWYMRGTNFNEDGKATGNQQTIPDPGSVDGTPKPFDVHGANQDDEEHVARLTAQYNEYMFHEWVVTWKTAGPQLFGIKLNSRIGVQGVGEAVDGWFQIQSVEHDFNFQRGYIGTASGRWGRILGDAG